MQQHPYRRPGSPLRSVLTSLLLALSLTAGAGETGIGRSHQTPVVDSLLDHIFAAESLWHNQAGIAAARLRFEALVEGVRERLPADGDRDGIIAAFNQVLLYEHLLTYRNERYWRDASLVGLLQERQGNCWSITVLYLMVGWQLDLPFQMVRQADHVLVRWAGERPCDIETTDLGLIQTCDPEARLIVDGRDLDSELLRRRLTWHRQQGHGELPLSLHDDTLARFWWQWQHPARDPDPALAQTLLQRGEPDHSTRIACLRILSEDFQRRGDLATAYTLLQQASALAHPPLRRALIGQSARLLLALDHPEAASRLVEELPAATERLILEAGIARHQARFPAALAAIRRARALAPERPDLAVAEAAILIGSGQSDEAASLIAPVEESVATAAMTFNLAWYHLLATDLDRSAAYLRRACELAGTERIRLWLGRNVAFRSPLGHRVIARSLPAAALP